MSGGISITQSKIHEADKFEDIISELGRRGVVVLVNRSTRWGYVVDAVVPSEKAVILKMPDMNRQTRVALSTFRDMTGRLEGDGYRVLVVPRSDMSQEQIKAFCDRISGESSLAVA